MKLDNESIVSKYYEEYPFSHVPIDSYNWFIKDGIKQLYDKMKLRIRTAEGYVNIELVHDNFTPNTMLAREDTEQMTDIVNKYHSGIRYEFPIDILRKAGNYTATQESYLVMTNDEGEELMRERLTIMRSFPIMVMSDLCPLSSVPRNEWKHIPHCDLDHGGYFIYKTEKILVNKENLAADTTFTVRVKLKSGEKMKPKGDVFARFLSTSGDIAKSFYLYVNKEEGISITTEAFVMEINLQTVASVLISVFDIDMTERELLNEYSKEVPEELKEYLLNSDSDDVIDFETLVRNVKKKTVNTERIARICIADAGIDDLEDGAMRDLIRNMSNLELGNYQEKYDIEKLSNSYINAVLDAVVMKHLLPSASSWQQKMKIMFDMITDVSRVHVEGKGITNKNHYAQKLITSAGMHIYSFYSKLSNDNRFWSIPNASERQAPQDIFKFVLGKVKKVGDILDKEFKTAYIQKTWATSSETSHVSVIEELPTDSLLNRIVMTKKISAFFQEASKASESRLYYPSYAHIICPASTPESTKCGFTKHLTPSVSITNNIIPDVEVETINKMSHETKDIKVYVNNILYGKIDMDDYHELQRMTEEETNGVRFHFHTTVTLVKRTRSVRVKETAVFIFTSKGRTVYPVLILKKGVPKIELDGEVEAVNRGDYSFSEMIRRGYIKYIDVTHSEFSNIALTQENLAERSNWDYMYLSPSFFVGMEVNVMNFPNYNPVGRIMLTAKHLKQMISVPYTNWKARRDLEIKKLWYPQKQLFQTKMYKRLGLDQLGTCQNVLVAVATRGLGEQDDAFMMKKEFYQRGGAVATLFKTIKIESEADEIIDISGITGVGDSNMRSYHKFMTETFHINAVVPEKVFRYGSDYELDSIVKEKLLVYKQPGKSDIERKEWVTEDTTPSDKITLFRIPGGEWSVTEEEDILPNFETKELVRVRGDIQLRRLFDNFEGDTDIRVRRTKAVYKSIDVYRKAVEVKKGDVVARIVKNIDKEQDLEIVRKEKTNLRSAVVDGIFSDNVARKASVIKVRLRSVLHPNIGDKFAFPYAQKGVLGIIQSEIDMPRLPDGRVPDIIINAQNFPSRNTMGLLLEMIAGSAILSVTDSDVYRPIKDGERISTSVWKPVEDEYIFSNRNATQYSDLSRDDKERFNYIYGPSPYETIKELSFFMKRQGIDVDIEGFPALISEGGDFDIAKGVLDIKYINSADWKFPGYELLEKLVIGHEMQMNPNRMKTYTMVPKQAESLLKSFTTKKLAPAWLKILSTEKGLKYLSQDAIDYFREDNDIPEIESNFTSETQITLADINSYLKKKSLFRYHYYSIGTKLDYSLIELIKIKAQGLIYRPLLMKRMQLAYNISKREDVIEEQRLRDAGIEMEGKEEDYKKLMVKHGLNTEGTTHMYNINGEIMGSYSQEQFVPEQFAVGYASILRLKHCVEEKYQATAKGKRKLNNKPHKGKGKEGGISYGEMMTWSSQAHGISNFLREKLRDHSDKTHLLICSHCKRLTSLNPEDQCYYCNESDVAQVSATFGLYLLDQYNSMMGNMLEYELEESDEIEDVVSKLRPKKNKK